MKIFLLILAVVGTGLGFVQHGKIRTVHAQIDSHRASLAEVQTLSAQLDSAQPVTLTEAQIASLRAERAELMQLRAGLPKLRDQARSTNEFAAEIARLNAEATRHQVSARAIETAFVEEQRSKAVRGVLDQFKVCLAMVRVQPEVPLPRSVTEVERLIAAGGGQAPVAGNVWTNLGRSFPPFHVSRESFEFLPNHSPLLLRERQPRHLPDGQWARYYLRTNLQTVQILQSTEDFTTWEARQ